MLLGEGSHLRTAHNRAVVVDQLADCCDWLDARQPTQIDRRLGMARAHQNPAILGDQRENVAGPDEIRRTGIAVCKVADRRGPFFGRNTGRRSVPIIDRNREGRSVDRVVVRNHGSEMQAPGSLRRQWRGDDAAGVPDDESHFLRSRVYRRQNQVSLVLAVVVVGHDDDFAAAERADGFSDTSLGHSSVSNAASLSRWRPKISDWPGAA